MFEVLKNDPFIESCFNKISEVEIRNQFWADHGKKHTFNVIELATSLGKLAGLDDNQLERLKIAALLHDIGNVYGKPNHAEKSYLMSREILSNYESDLMEYDDILDAIRYHGSGNNNILCRLLTIADKMDITKDRLTDAAYNVEGIRQYQYINKIEIKLDEDKIIFDFIIDEEFDLDEFKEFYFYPKVMKAMKDYATLMDKDLVVNFNLKKNKK